MEIIGSRRKSLLSPAGDAAPTIPIYRSAPELEVRLEDFELYAVHRLRGLFLCFRVSGRYSLRVIICIVSICWIEFLETEFVARGVLLV